MNATLKYIRHISAVRKEVFNILVFTNSVLKEKGRQRLIPNSKDTTPFRLFAYRTRILSDLDIPERKHA